MPRTRRPPRTTSPRAGLAGHLRYHVGDAVTWLNDTPGEFDVIYDDIDKDGYPDAWRAARERVRVGGLYICDNVLWSGRVAPDGEPPDDVTPAILEHNAMIAADDRYASSILPIRDGVMGRPAPVLSPAGPHQTRPAPVVAGRSAVDSARLAGRSGEWVRDGAR